MDKAERQQHADAKWMINDNKCSWCWLLPCGHTLCTNYYEKGAKTWKSVKHEYCISGYSLFAKQAQNTKMWTFVLFLQKCRKYETATKQSLYTLCDSSHVHICVVFVNWRQKSYEYHPWAWSMPYSHWWIRFPLGL